MGIRDAGVSKTWARTCFKFKLRIAHRARCSRRKPRTPNTVIKADHRSVGPLVPHLAHPIVLQLSYTQLSYQ